MAVCAPLRRAHSPPVPGTGKPCSLSFHLQKSVLQGAWRHSPAYLCARPLAGRAGTPKGQRISGKIGGSAAGNAHRAHTRIHAPRHKHRRAPNAYRHTPDTRPMRAIARAYARETAPRGFPRDVARLSARFRGGQRASCAARSLRAPPWGSAVFCVEKNRFSGMLPHFYFIILYFFENIK